jgi:short-subunit dehydrogenase
MHAFVTGASSGIGEAIARELAAAGYDLTLVARREAELDRVARELAVRVDVMVRPFDVAAVTELEALVAGVVTDRGPIDVLVNNAGYELIGWSKDVDIDAVAQITRVNYLAPCALMRAVIPGMMERRRGAIVNVASVAAYTSPPFLTYYSGSKAALAAVSVSLHSELKPLGIRVVTVYPGPIHTAMGERSVARYAREPTRGIPWGRADVLARCIVAAIRSGRRAVIYPWFYHLPLWLPRLSRRVMNLLKTEPKAEAHRTSHEPWGGREHGRGAARSVPG